MKKLSFNIAIAALLVSSVSFAGQENKGMGKPAEYTAVCSTASGATIEVSQSTASKYLIQVSVDESKASAKTETYTATKVKVAPGVMGAPMEFTGRGIDLSICVDCAPKQTPEGIAHSATVSAPALGLQGETALCRLK